MKKKILPATILILSLLVIIILYFFYKSPILSVNNSNRLQIATYVCNNSNGYYYIDNNGISFFCNGKHKNIFKISDANAVACNDKYIYISASQELIQINLDGKIINKIAIDNTVTQMYADNSFLIFNQKNGFSYILSAENLNNNISLCDLLENYTKSIKSNTTIYNGNNVRIITNAPKSIINENNFVGTIIFNNSYIMSSIASFYLGYYNNQAYYYSGDKQTQISNEDKVVYDYNFDIDFRHIFIEDNKIFSFASKYKKNHIFNIFSSNDKEYINDGKIISEKNLSLHKYDIITIFDTSNNCERQLFTREKEKIIFLNESNAITYYNGHYLTYDLNNWEVIKKQDADEIKNGGSYTFETCGDYIFVFDDDSGELLNMISIK